jgi:hypothetical protein
MQAQVPLFSVENNEHLTCSIEFSRELPVVNPKYTVYDVVAYLGFKTVEGHTGKRYLATVKKDCHGKAFALPRGAIVHFVYATGTKSTTYHKYVQFFIVTTGRFEGELKDLCDGGADGKVNLKFVAINLKPIESPDEKSLVEAEAEIRNHGWLPSIYDPVRLLWHYWVKAKIVQQAPQPSPSPATAGPQNIDQAILELEKLIAEKERELAELKAKLEELTRLKSVSGRVASLAVEVKA